MLTKAQRNLLEFIVAEHAAGRSPSYAEMAAALGLRSRSGVFRLVECLVERGFLERGAGRARSIQVVKVPGPAEGGAFRGAATVVADGGQLSPGPDGDLAAFPFDAMMGGPQFTVARIRGSAYGGLALSDGDWVVFAPGREPSVGTLVMADDLARVDAEADGGDGSLPVRYADGRRGWIARDVPVAVTLVRTAI